MKKVFGLLFVAGLFTFASCNNTEETATEVEATETETVETVEVETDVEADTTATMEDTTAVQ
ncbi:hypothetical protein [Pontibacter indicus]|uniref:Uncharacterized protein n=1 Tax=Pontibacter indicus TaxID=1317125 RepID=A0A1R3XT31_9BACT|nr:hypothetical protein [Pontibacter indicus]SIT95031.1 hypothetical protein SAMN05444128_3874 [Pontibacter indicus]